VAFFESLSLTEKNQIVFARFFEEKTTQEILCMYFGYFSCKKGNTM